MMIFNLFLLIFSFIMLLFITFGISIIVVDFIQTFIIPMIPSISLYKRNGVIICNKEHTNYHVCISYRRKQYHFYNKILYDSTKVGEFLYASTCQKHKRLYIKHDGTVYKSSKKYKEKA